MSNAKSGWKTTEFWMTLGTSVAAVVVAMCAIFFGGDTAGLNEAIVQLFVGLGAVAGSAAVVWKYIGSRTEIKKNEPPESEGE